MNFLTVQVKFKFIKARLELHTSDI